MNMFEHGGGGCSCTVKFEHVQDGGEGPCTVMSKLNKYENVGEGQSSCTGSGGLGPLQRDPGQGPGPWPCIVGHAPHRMDRMTDGQTLLKTLPSPFGWRFVMVI